MATKALISTTATQNDYPGDFCWTEDGEVVVSGVLGMCESHRHAGSDGISRCGCDRAWSGVSSGRHTTTAAVADVPETRDQLIQRYADRIQTSYALSEAEAMEAATDVMGETLDFAAELPVGRIVRCTSETMFAAP